MSSADGASSRPEGASPEGSDPSWTPKEPNRPLLPKPGAFGVSKTFPHPPKEPNGPSD